MVYLAFAISYKVMPFSNFVFKNIYELNFETYNLANEEAT